MNDERRGGERRQADDDTRTNATAAGVNGPGSAVNDSSSTLNDPSSTVHAPPFTSSYSAGPPGERFSAHDGRLNGTVNASFPLVVHIPTPSATGPAGVRTVVAVRALADNATKARQIAEMAAAAENARAEIERLTETNGRVRLRLVETAEQAERAEVDAAGLASLVASTLRHQPDMAIHPALAEMLCRHLPEGHELRARLGRTAR
ncbi:MAG: hypothetical protein LBK95_00395 [Bifidobacteriaceae bacterium]|nr:hypothetical protein [Bifidobacteriaceae bacterium]